MLKSKEIVGLVVAQIPLGPELEFAPSNRWNVEKPIRVASRGGIARDARRALLLCFTMTDDQGGW